MLSNDVLRRARYILDYKDKQMTQVFAHVGVKVSQERLVEWLKKDDDPKFVKCEDIDLANFLNGLIIEKRGKKDGELPIAEVKLTNNLIFRKFIIAFSLKSDDVLEILKLSGFTLGKAELSAFFRKPSHKHYRQCQDQVLRNFLAGLQLKLRT